MPPPLNAVLPVTITAVKFTVEPQQFIRMPPPAPKFDLKPPLIVSSLPVTVRPPLIVSVEPAGAGVAFVASRLALLTPWIVTLTVAVNVPTHGFGPNRVTVPPEPSSPFTAGSSLDSTPVHVYEP